MKFGEHLYDAVLERVPHRHCGFTLPKRLRIYFRYDRRLLDLLFRAAASAVRVVLGSDTHSPGLVLTYTDSSPTAASMRRGILLNSPPSTPRAWPRTSVTESLLSSTPGGLSPTKYRLRSSPKSTQASVRLSPVASCEGGWVGEPFDEPDRTKFVARYIERGPLALEKLTIQDDIITYTTKDGRAHEFDTMEFLALLSTHIPKPYESITRYYGWLRP